MALNVIQRPCDRSKKGPYASTPFRRIETRGVKLKKSLSKSLGVRKQAAIVSRGYIMQWSHS